MKMAWFVSTALCVAAVLAPIPGGIAVAQDADAAAAKAAAPADAQWIRQQMETLVAGLDAALKAGVLSPEELIVIAYQLSQGRTPTALEFFVSRAQLEECALTANQLLSQIVCGGEAAAVWDRCRAFLEKAVTATLASTPETKALAAELAATPRAKIGAELKAAEAKAAAKAATAIKSAEEAAPAPKAGVQYNTYFGDIHNHSTLSDGDLSPAQAYAHARDVGKVDYFSLADHAEQLIIWPWDNKWDELKDTANAYNAPGTFATLFGFEWSEPLLGHVNVWNTSDMTSAVTSLTMSSLYGWIADRPAGFGRFNHPGRYDSTGGEFSHFDLESDVVSQMVGVDTFDKGDAFEEYFYVDGYGSGKSYLDLAIQKGWYVGPVGSQDNHGSDMGESPYSTAVLATELTREAIIDAYRNRRFYSTENRNLYLDVRCAGYPMGSKLTGVPRLFNVSTHTDGGEMLKEVRLYRNGTLLRTTPVNGTSAQVDLLDTAPNAQDYYYVIVALTTGDHGGHPDEAISSPIWCTGNADVQPAAAFSGTPTSGIAPLTVQFTDQSSPGTKPITAWAWDFGDGSTSTDPSPSHTYTAGGAYTVSLRVTTAAGESTETKAGYINADNSIPPSGTVLINGNRSATNTTLVSLALTWTPGSGGNVVRMRFSDDGAHWTAWEPLAATRAYTLPGGDGHKTVRVQFLDKANQRSAAAHDYIRLDMTPPTGGIIINGGALTTTNPLVTLNLTWADSGSQVARMRFSDDGAHWTIWEPLNPAPTHLLPPPNGYHTVRVQYRDGAGNYSPVYNDYIKLMAP